MNIKLLLLSDFNIEHNIFNYYANNIYMLLCPLNTYYIGFNKWYYNKVIPDIKIGIRDIIMITNNNKIIGISIIKNTKSEQKICTLYVLPKFRKMGIGKLLIFKSLELLNTDKPMITISEDKILSFIPLLDYFEFELSEMHPNLYQKNKIEMIYNGSINI